MPDDLETRLKRLIVETLNLPDVSPGDIGDEQQLMGGDLGLDSIDALELVVQLEKQFGVKLDSSEQAKDALGSVRSMARLIRLQRGEAII